MQLEIDVTPDDISKGRAGEYNACPIALALKRQGCSELRVEEGGISFKLNELNYKFETPIKAQVFIDDFDNHKTVKPFKFILEKPNLT